MAKVLWIVVWLRHCGLLCGKGIVDCCVAKVLWIVVWQRYCGLLYGLHWIVWLRYCGLLCG